MQRRNLIIFFVPPEKVVNGGIMAIFNHCTQSRQFEKIHQADCVLSTYPGSKTYHRNDLFENDEEVYSFDEIISKWKDPKKLLLHIPETAVRVANKAFAEKKYRDYLAKIPEIHINVMNQNIELMRDVAEFAELFKITPTITQTTAHHRYTTQELSNKYQTPVHHLSVPTDIRQFKSVSFKDKKDLIIYSPDEHTAKDRILSLLKSTGRFELKEIRGMPYQEYERLTSSAKFCLTFGEGFDGYFLRGFFYGSVGLAVYNDEFFPDKSYRSLSSVFTSYPDMEDRLLSIIQEFDNEKVYDQYVAMMQSKLSKLYGRDKYIKKLENFYKGNYDIQPEAAHVQELVVSLLASRDLAIKNLRGSIADKQAKISRLESEIQDLVNSKSWKVTKPLRKINKARP